MVVADNLQGSADIIDALSLVKKLISCSQLAHDLLGDVQFSFHRASLGQIWPIGQRP